MPTTFTTSFPVTRGCTGTKRVVGSDPPKKMRFLQLSLQKSPREAMSVANYLSGSGGGRSLFIDPSGKGFSRPEERWGGLDGHKQQWLDRDRHPSPRRSRPPRRHSIVGSAPGPRQGPDRAPPPRTQERGLIFTGAPCYIFSSRRSISPARTTQREVGKEIAKANAIGLALALSSRKASARRLWLASLKPSGRTSRSPLTTRNGLSPVRPQASEESS